MANLRTRGRSPQLVLCLLLVGLLLPGGPARAQPPAPPPAPAETPVAEEDGASEDLDQVVAGHVRRAEEAQRRGKWADAVSELRAAYSMDPQPLLLYQAGTCYQRAGQGKEAIAMYRDYLQKDPAGPKRAEAEAAVRELQLVAAPDRAPVWKRGWFWAVIGGAAVVGIGLGVGLGLGLRSNDISTPL